MTAPRHTPGPWEVGTLNGHMCIAAKRDHVVVRIAGIPDWRERHQEELDANISLLATTPELLEVLKAVEHVLKHCVEYRRVGLRPGPEVERAFELVRDVIAKAEGA